MVDGDEDGSEDVEGGYDDDGSGDGSGDGEGDGEGDGGSGEGRGPGRGSRLDLAFGKRHKGRSGRPRRSPPPMQLLRQLLAVPRQARLFGPPAGWIDPLPPPSFARTLAPALTRRALPPPPSPAPFGCQLRASEFAAKLRELQMMPPGVRPRREHASPAVLLPPPPGAGRFSVRRS